MRKTFICAFVFAVLVVSCPGWTQQTADQAIANLGQLTSTDGGEWRFQHPAQPGGEKPDLDDSQWLKVRPEHSWEGENTAAWYRQLIVVPQTVGGASPAGSRLTLRCAVDDAMEIYVNGELKGKFPWDQGVAILADNATPGDKFLVAIKAINYGGPGRLMSASLTYDAFADMREGANQCRVRLEFCKRLLDAKRIADKRAEFAKILDDAAAKLDFSAVSKRDKAAFEASCAECVKALQPFAVLAKQYTLYLVGHAHIDMNWLWLWPETKEVCRATWTQALNFMDEFPGFKFSQSQPGAYIAIEKEHPELFRRIQEAVKRGDWEATGAGWVENDMNMPSGEAVARQCLLTNAFYLSRFGKASDMAWAPDTFGHAWTVPSILADAGYKHYFFCRCGKGEPLFWWEGPDGARLAAYSYGSYGEQIRPDRASWALDIDNRLGIPSAMVVYGVGDHGGGPTREDLTIATQLQKEPIFPKVVFATTDDYFNSALQASGGKLPVVRDELNFTFEGCYTTHADIKRWNRESENLLAEAESISAVAHNWGAPYPAEAFTQGWRNTCFDQFHDIFCGSAIHPSYDYSRGLYQQAHDAATGAISGSLRSLEAQIDTSGAGIPILVWNPVAWDRKDAVQVKLTTPEEWKGASLLDAEGAAVPAQVVGSTKQGDGYETTLVFVAQLPSLGYAVFHAQAAPAPAGSGVHELTPEEVAAGMAIFAEGGIPLSFGEEGKPYASLRAGLQMLHEDPHGMSAWNLGTITKTEDLKPAEFGPTVTGPVFTRHQAVFKYGKSTLTLTGTLYSDMSRRDFDLDADWQEIGNGKDGGPLLKASFATSATNPTATFEIPFGSIERRASGAEVPAQKWIDVAQTQRTIPPGGREAKALDIGKYFNLDVIATPANPGDGDFDGGQRAYSSEIFGAAGAMLSVEGVPFYTPPLADGAKNAVAAQGQTLEWAAEACPALAVLGSSCNGSHGGLAELLYADGSSQSVELSFSDWCASAAAGEKDAFSLDYRLAPTGRIEPPNHIWMRRLPADPAKPLRGITLPNDPNLKVFGLAFAARDELKQVWGVSLLNDSKYGFDVKGGTMRMSLLRASYDPDPTPDQGRHHVRYAVLGHQGSWREVETPRRAYEFNNPPVAIQATVHPGALPPSYTFVRVAPGNMILSAFKRAEDGNGTIARVYNSTGVGGTATLLCNLPFSGAVACNLLEQARPTNVATVNFPEVTLDLEGRIHGTVRLLPQ